MRRRARAPAPAGSVRIIAGRWRGRRLPVIDGPALRPTPDRVRETLFNWLAPHLPGARCLDLFAGTGALGLEAASRGAVEVVLVENDPHAVAALQASVARLRALDVRIVAADVPGWLAGRGRPFDIVFLDPPYGAGISGRCCLALDAHGWLAAAARVYLEGAAAAVPASMPQRWRLHRELRAGEVHAALFEVGGDNDGTRT